MSDGPAGVTGTIFDIQHYALHDGPGIRTVVFLKGCPLRCPWCANPESQRATRELRHVPALCRRCRACAAACPLDAVGDGVDGPVHDRARCAVCADWPCLAHCPGEALTAVGRTATAAEVVARVAADLPYYRRSGGGVTFSGGEPCAQAPFLAALLTGCRERGIHTALETCGAVAASVLAGLAPLVDLVLYDLKLVDAERHRALTGADNRLILANLRWLAARRRESLVLRFPLIPGGTDDDANVAAVAAVAAELGLAVEVEPYHPLGEAKYANLGRDDGWRGVPPLAPQRLAAVLARFADAGVACSVG